MTFLSKFVHVAWTFKGPELLTRARKQWPKQFRPSAGWYHDIPTAIIAGVSLCEEALRCHSRPLLWKGEKSCSLMAIGAGLAWHNLSVFVLARRVPQYHFRSLSKVQLAQTITVAAAEEIIWRTDGGYTSRLIGSTGFGLTHLRIGSIPGVIHMGIFALIARYFERRHGLAASALFHSSYNIAHESESHRDKK